MTQRVASAVRLVTVTALLEDMKTQGQELLGNVKRGLMQVRRENLCP